jgi:hypothetical protein
MNGKKGWEFRSKIKKKKENTLNISSATYPIGRQKWHMEDPSCDHVDRMKTLTLSQCYIETEFTCDSGDCIEIEKRCNGNRECADGSDEQKCNMMYLPDSYQRKDAPPRLEENHDLELVLKVDVMKIDLINTLDKTVTITVNVNVEWYDKRLKFSNLIMGRENSVPDKATKTIWLPLHGLILENAIIGEIKYDKLKSIHVTPQLPIPISPDFAYENVLYDGSNTLIEVNQRMKIKFDCPFEVRRFPFDDQKCELFFKMDSHKQSNVVFIRDDHVVYNGRLTVDQFIIRPMTSYTSNTDNSTRFVLVIPFRRNPSNQLLKTFLPTFLLGLLGYSTIFIDTKRPGDRFMGSATMILVLATWISVISGDLPKTSYIKLIDIWFVWHVTTTFSIVIYHIVLDRFLTKPTTLMITTVSPQLEENDGPDMVTKRSMNQITRINKAIITVFTIINFAFYVVYFFLSIH